MGTSGLGHVRNRHAGQRKSACGWLVGVLGLGSLSALFFCGILYVGYMEWGELFFYQPMAGTVRSRAELLGIQDGQEGPSDTSLLEELRMEMERTAALMRMAQQNASLQAAFLGETSPEHDEGHAQTIEAPATPPQDVQDHSGGGGTTAEGLETAAAAGAASKPAASQRLPPAMPLPPQGQGESCLTPADCTLHCRTACDVLPNQMACSAFCSQTCQRRCGSGRHLQKDKAPGRKVNRCEASCVASCRTECLGSFLNTPEKFLPGCSEFWQGQCKTRCAGPRAPQQGLTNESCNAKCRQDADVMCGSDGIAACRSRCGRHVCVNGLCTCPLMSAGDPFCELPTHLSELLPNRYRHCGVALAHRSFSSKGRDQRARDVGWLAGSSRSATWVVRLRQRVQGLPVTLSSDDEDGVESTAAPDSSAATVRLLPDLRDLADFSTCAVVGSSSSLLDNTFGSEIDAHTAVIRYNDAPTHGYEPHVGSRTTLRIQNVLYCGFGETTTGSNTSAAAPPEEELCMQYTGWKGNRCSSTKMRRAKCNLVMPSQRLLAYVAHYWPKEQFPRARDLSAGFFGMLLAMQLCGKVDVYGYSHTNAHYYNKRRSANAVSFGARHSWVLERECMNVFQVYPGVKKWS